MCIVYNLLTVCAKIWNYGEGGADPGDYGFRFRAGGTWYTVQVGDHLMDKDVKHNYILAQLTLGTLHMCGHTFDVSML